MNMKITYVVRFNLYHYNSGKGDNGNYAHKESFTNLTEANSFADKLKTWLKTDESTSKFASEYCWDGYLVSVDGIYEITEKKVQ
jgi:hypothetical protein